jgi:hypothetical protein
MHRKPVFVLAGIFLAVALIVPPVILSIQSDQDLDNYIIARNDPSMSTGGNTSLYNTLIEEINERHQNSVLIVSVIEAIFLPLFLIALYYGIKHTHPEH